MILYGYLGVHAFCFGEDKQILSAVEFKILRESYAEKQEFDGDWVSNPIRKNLLDIYEKDPKLFVVEAKEWLMLCPVDANMHLMLADVMRDQGDTVNSLHHRYYFYGLLHSILAGKNGESKEHAFVVISADEVQTVLHYFEAKLIDRNLEYPFDIIKVSINDMEKELHFDVRIPFRAIHNQRNASQ